MAKRTLVAFLAWSFVALSGGCHSSRSNRASYYTQPAVVTAAPAPCPTGCATPAAPAAPAAPGPNAQVPPPPPGFAR